MSSELFAETFRHQATWCARLGSPLYAELLERAADDIRDGGPVARLLDGWVGNPLQDALPLRLMGALHARVLEGKAPSLARFYPSVGGTPEFPAAWEAFIAEVESQFAALKPELARGVQTNEVNRCAALLGGFLEIAARAQPRLRVREIGTSAGLNLLWDRYRYEIGPYRWGDPTAEVAIRVDWTGGAPRLDAAPVVVSRAGCDIAPVDISRPEQRRRLESFIWPDQVERRAQFRAAARAAGAEHPRIDHTSAAPWLTEELGSSADGITTVVFHSIMWWYMPPDERDAVTATIEAAGARATPRAPVAWLTMEVRSHDGADLRLRLWPGSEEVILADVTPHGRDVHWRL